MKYIILALTLVLSCSLHAQVKRRVLLEIFSTERCNNCPQAHRNIERIFGDGGDSIIYLGHHAGFYTDDFSLAESVEYEWFYTPDRGTYAPAAMMDRTCDADALPNVFGDGVPVFDGSKTSCLQPAYALAADVPAYARIKAEASYDAATRQLSATINGKLLREIPIVNDLRLNVFLTEDSVFTASQSGSYGQYYHRHLARHCLTGTWGEPVPMDESFERSYTFTLPDEWNEQHVEIVAFVTNYNPNDRCNCQVMNACHTAVLSSSTEAISQPRIEVPSTATYNVFGQKLYDNESLTYHNHRGAGTGQLRITPGTGIFLVR